MEPREDGKFRIYGYNTLYDSFDAALEGMKKMVSGRTYEIYQQVAEVKVLKPAPIPNEIVVVKEYFNEEEPRGDL